MKPTLRLRKDPQMVVESILNSATGIRMAAGSWALGSNTALLRQSRKLGPLFSEPQNSSYFLPQLQRHTNGKLKVVYALISLNFQGRFKFIFQQVFLEIEPYFRAYHQSSFNGLKLECGLAGMLQDKVEKEAQASDSDEEKRQS